MKKYILIYLSILLFLSLNPWLRPDSSGVAESSFLTWDFIDHSIAYAVLTIMLLASCSAHLKHPLITLAVLLSVVFLGFFIEVAQMLFTTGRQFSLLDAEANASGALVGVLFYISIISFYNSWRNSI
jgi:VanZ family protein